MLQFQSIKDCGCSIKAKVVWQEDKRAGGRVYVCVYVWGNRVETRRDAKGVVGLHLL